MLKQLDDNSWGIVVNNEIIVRASIWLHTGLPENHSLYRVGIIGNFECHKSAELTQSYHLFEHLVQALKSKGAEKIIGPMNGNTWQPYRLTTHYGVESAFLLEPYTPQHYIQHWENAGFIDDEIYSSYIEDISSFNDPREEKLKNKFSHLTFSPLSENDLSAIFDLSIESFTKNPYYVSIDKSIYLQKYGKLLTQLKPNLSLCVYDKDDLVGYFFVMLDQDPKRIILKTIAINSHKQYAGLGIYLMIKAFKKAQLLGVKYAIHALSYDGNAVQNITKQKAILMRKYTLYQLNKDCVLNNKYNG